MNSDFAPLSILKLTNTRCFAEAQIDLDPRLTVIIGENGTGKTTIAEAIASMSWGDDEGLKSFPLRRGTESGEIAVHCSRVEPDGKDHHGHGCRWDSERERGELPRDTYVFAYGRYRRVQFPEDFDDELATDRERSETGPLAALRMLDQMSDDAYRYRSLTLNEPDARLLGQLNLKLRAIYEAIDHDPRMGALWERLNLSLKELGQGLEELRMIEGKFGFTPRLVRKGVELGINELSDGYQAILVIVIDLLWRYRFLFPIDDEPWAGSAIVVIDEVDLHLHVRWQRVVLKQLTTLFPNTQFIVTTHSAAVVQGAIDDGFPVVVLQEKKGAVVPKTLSDRKRKQLQGADIASLLTESNLFGVKSRYSPEYQELEAELQKLRRKMEKGQATQADHARMFELADIFENLMAGEEERRADGAFLSEMSKLNTAFLKDIAAELGKEQ
ncbi:AAA family ATPase [bacterium]|nr:AAA family ATPase [bacterium]